MTGGGWVESLTPHWNLAGRFRCVIREAGAKAARLPEVVAQAELDLMKVDALAELRAILSDLHEGRVG
jgi:hypothetical protein